MLGPSPPSHTALYLCLPGIYVYIYLLERGELCFVLGHEQPLPLLVGVGGRARARARALGLGLGL